MVSAQQVATNASKFITVPFEGTDGLDIHYIASEPESADKGPTFVLLHGSLFNAFTWNEVMDFFSERGPVVAYDQIPYGLSEKLVAGDWTERNPYTSEAAVDQLFLFLDALDVDKVVLVGNSYGGTLAVQAALAQPERVEALILVDAAVYVQEEMAAWGVGAPDFVTHIPDIQQPTLVVTGDSDAVYYIDRLCRQPIFQDDLKAEPVNRATGGQLRPESPVFCGRLAESQGGVFGRVAD